jgi:hypothetical protein
VSDDDRLLDLEFEYDPLAVDDAVVAEAEDEDAEFIGLIERPVDTAIDSPEVPLRPPEKRIADLLASLSAQKKVLLGIMGFCREPQSPRAVDEFTLDLQKTNRSVYTPVILRKLLEEAGALSYEQADGEQDVGAGDGVAQEAAAVALAGEAGEPPYLLVTKRAEGTWVSTTAALGILDAIEPLEDLRTMLAEEEGYLEIYLRILRHCAEQSRTKTELNELVDDDPLLQSPRRYSGFFIDRLNECGALEWRPLWAATSIGLELIEEFDCKRRGSLEKGEQ